MKFKWHYLVALTVMANSSACTPQTEQARLTSECKEQNAESCFSLANFYYSLGQSDENIDKAVKYHLAACKLRLNSSCFAAASIVLKTDSPTKEQKEATQQGLLQSCNSGHNASCYLLASYHHIGFCGKKDKNKSFKFFKQSGELAYGHIGDMYLHGDGVAQDLIAATKYYRQACLLENWKSCCMYQRLTTKSGLTMSKKVQNYMSRDSRFENFCSDNQIKSGAENLFENRR